MCSKTFDGAWFAVYSHDHAPPHVHGSYADILVIVDLFPGEIRQSERTDAIRPKNAKRSHVKRILDIAAAHQQELLELWERTHGTTSEKCHN